MKKRHYIRLSSLTGIEVPRLKAIYHDLACNYLHDKYYKRYYIRQGRKKRNIEEPVPELKKIQSALIGVFSEFPFHDACMAVPGKNTLDNAKIHEDATYVLKVDIKNCYKSIGINDLVGGIQTNVRVYPGTTPSMAYYLPFCTYIERVFPSPYLCYLPTGAPTSPILCNIALSTLDINISTLAYTHNYRYTRYLDDIVLSTKSQTRRWELIDEVIEILWLHDLPHNPRKTKWYTVGAADQVLITGVSIGKQRIGIKRDLRKMIKSRLNDISKSTNGEIDSHTAGLLAYVKSIDPEVHKKLIQYFNKRQENEAAKRISLGSK